MLQAPSQQAHDQPLGLRPAGIASRSGATRTAKPAPHLHEGKVAPQGGMPTQDIDAEAIRCRVHADQTDKGVESDDRTELSRRGQEAPSPVVCALHGADPLRLRHGAGAADLPWLRYGAASAELRHAGEMDGQGVTVNGGQGSVRWSEGTAERRTVGGLRLKAVQVERTSARLSSLPSPASACAARAVMRSCFRRLFRPMSLGHHASIMQCREQGIAIVTK